MNAKVFVFLLVVLLLVPNRYASGFWRRRRRRRSPPPPPPDHAPTFTYCPSTLYEYTEAADGQKRVYYETPRATDDRSTPSVSLDSGLPSGSIFPEGDNSVTYVAIDSSNKRTYCYMTIRLKVRRCPTIPPSSHRSASCSKTNIVGSNCTFSCQTGYNLIGPPTLTCLKTVSGENYYWSDAFPICEVVTCSPYIASIDNGRVSCTNTNQYNSMCTYYCDTGFGFSSGASSVTQICGSTGNWSIATPTCIDIQPPTFISCPESITYEAENASTSVVVSWNVPIVTDNVLSGLTLTQTQVSVPGSHFQQGTHTITYTARDGQGNTETCTFTITVRVISCNRLMATEGLVITCPNGFVKEASCTFQCDVGYQLVGANSSTCDSNALWAPAQPTCQIRSCPALTPPSHGTFRHSQPCASTYGSWCYFECDTGYRITGSAARRCIVQQGQTSPFWDGNPTGCEVHTCQTLQPGPGLFLVPSDNCSASDEVLYGNICSYECTEGYALQGESSLTCGAGYWLQVLPVCEVITCASSDLPAPANGVKSGCSRDYEPYGTTCTLSCNRGYTPTTAVQRTCQSDEFNNGVWSDRTISCSAVTCPPLAALTNGFVSDCVRDGHNTTIMGSQLFDTTCSFACREGFMLFGTASQNCLVSGSWDGNSAQCRDVTAPEIECPEDQVVFADEGQNVGTVSFHWEPVMGTDAGSDIPAILQTINSVAVSSRPVVLEEGIYSLLYTATDLAGNSKSCGMLIEVKVTRCSGLTAPLNGVMHLVSGHGSCAEGAVYGSQCEITCDAGYTLSTEGSSLRRLCSRWSSQSTQGFWTLEQPTCNAVTCSFPNVTNGYINGCHSDPAPYGDVCEFHCYGGYRLPSGESYRERQCHGEGVWSGPDFQCTELATCSPFSILHGSVEPSICHQPDAILSDTVCNFYCDDGFLLQGPAAKICTSNGAWNTSENSVCLDIQLPRFEGDCPRLVTVESEYASTSQIVDFDEPTATDNSGNVTVIRRAGQPAPGSRLSEGHTTITYIATDPSGNSAQCDIIVTVVVRRCESLQAPTSGSLHCDHASPIAGTQCTVECNPGYALNGSQSHTCLLTSDGTPYWDGKNSTECTIRRCPSLPAPSNSFRLGCDSDTASEPYGTECLFYCLDGYEAETSDDGRARCLADGTWSGTDLNCTAVDCPVPSPAAGVVLSPAVCYDQPTFGMNCAFSCSQTGFTVVLLGSEYATCLSNGQWSQNVSLIQCTDQQSPHFSSCPYNLIAYADKGSTSAQVNLSVSAVDNDGLQPTVTCNPGSGPFELGTYWINCVAVDMAGNSGACSFQLEVIERRCPALFPLSSGVFLNECRGMYGSVCHLHCIDGYRLVGSSEVICEFNGTDTYWQIEDKPSCDLITCDALSLPDFIQVIPPSCSTGSPLAGTLCSFSCLYGLSFVGNMSVSCGDQSLWNVDTNSLSAMICKDHIPPVVSFCPESIDTIVQVPDGVSVTFNVPTAQDNLPSGSLTLVKLPDDIDSPYVFTESTNVSYTFTDEANNSATCAFRVNVIDELEPEVLSCPWAGYNITTMLTLTEVTWDEPIFEDPIGDDLVISSNLGLDNTAILPWGTHSVVYMATDTINGKTAVCEFFIDIQPGGCPSLNVPENGALSCSLWNYGSICTMSCNDGYDVPRLRSSQLPLSQYVCDLTGVWSPHSFVPDCSETKNPHRANLPVELMYFSGDCSSQSAMEYIAAAFVTLLENSAYSAACDPADQCTAGNVQVQCYASGQRRRRSLDDVREETYRNRLHKHPRRAEQEEAKWSGMQPHFTKMTKSSLSRRPRDTLDWEVFILFEFGSVIHYEGGLDSYSATLDTESVLIAQVEDFFTRMTDGTIPALQIPGVDLLLDDSSMTYALAEVTCDEGYVANNYDITCAACSTGFMYNSATGECEYCPRGYYQDQQAQLSCTQCPLGTSTSFEGAKNETWCQEECPRGSYSTTGVVPCFKCPVGKYQSEPGQMSCQVCPNGTTTVDYGTQSPDQCVEICSPGSVSETGLIPCRPCERRTYQPQSQQRHCILCPGDNITLTTGSISLLDCIDVDECASSPCDNEATCIDLVDTYRCDCPPGYQGFNCEEDIDYCVAHQCVNNATCVDGVVGYQCLCDTGFEGNFCELNIDECSSSPCENRGVCQDIIGGYYCRCLPSYYGDNCEHQIDGCLKTPCQNSGTCVVVDWGYECLCPAGYTGTNCTLDINECSSSPCLNGATCQDMLNAYNCMCAAGYDGPRCEVDIDLCAESPCHDGSTCVDLVSVFHCMCPIGRSGDLCDLSSSCDSAPCSNGATCASAEDGPNPYTCQCVAGYAGRNCEVDVNECASGPCLNGGTCTEHRLNAFMCDCPQGFEGDTCATDVDKCSSSPCEASSTCIDSISGYTCHCAQGFTGTHCDKPKDYCKSALCQHGSMCTNIGISYQCHCAAGYKGLDCEFNINECLSEPCQHDGTCTDENGGFSCTCTEAYTGTRCDIKINSCHPDTCQNNGTCVDGIADYTCLCRDGFTAAHCEVSIDYCQDRPCQNQGACQSNHGGYECSCLPGITGHNCDVNVDECSSFPCAHASSCVDGVNNYTCNCNDGYDGINCDQEINECDSNPCLHGGVCLDFVAGFVCQCVNGYTGNICQDNIDSCNEKPCSNGGTCVDELGTCKCELGYTGHFCEININDCDPNPCKYGGECKDELNGYVCQCLAGYAGTNCTVDIDECQQLEVQCQNGASCVDKVADFECFCAAGYGGRYCEEEENFCESEPCQNGGSCRDEATSYSCECPTGFTGVTCEVLVDLCADVPCSNGATCILLPGGFNCMCPTGYGGDLCDIQVNVDECMSQPCQNQASCVDELNGYWCSCLPGYTGVHCETELSSDFDLKFSDLTGVHLIQTNTLTLQNLTALSASLWLRSQSCLGDFTLMMLSTLYGPVIKISNPDNLTLSILGLQVFGPETAEVTLRDLCDGLWHSLIFTWQTLQEGQEWRMYIDKLLVAGGTVNISPATLPSGLVLSFGHAIGKSGLDGDQKSFELDLSGLNIWNKAWIEDEVLGIASACRLHSYADVFAWSQLLELPSAGITKTLRAPSFCDDMNECLSSPCQAGVCQDQLGKFMCHCPEGLEGDRCQNTTDYCQQGVCINNGMCQNDGIGDYMCICPEGYNGTQCELEIVDGGWGHWSPFSDCTKTCDGGSQLRSRVCDSPQPQNGGMLCQGEASQMQECNTDNCPACVSVRRPVGGSINCNETARILYNEMICTISCRPGMAFDRPALDVYRCGPSTSYAWNHQTARNPYARFPRCVEVRSAVGATSIITFDLKNAACNSVADQDAIKAGVTQSSAVQGLSCQQSQLCTVDVSVGNCKIDGSRVVRQADSNAEITLTITLDLTAVNTTRNTTAGNGNPVSQEFESLTDLVESGEFTAVVNGEDFQSDPDTVQTDSWDICPEGTAENQGACVECGEGTFLNQISVADIECHPCPANTYQDQQGQTECIPCPDGMITYGEGAINDTECYVQCSEGMYRVMSYIIGDNRCEPCPLNTYNPDTGSNTCIHCPEGLITDDVGATHETECHEFQSNTTMTTEDAPVRSAPPAGPPDSNALLVFMVVSASVILVFMLVILCLYCAKKRWRKMMIVPLDDDSAPAYEMNTKTTRMHLHQITNQRAENRLTSVY